MIHGELSYALYCDYPGCARRLSGWDDDGQVRPEAALDGWVTDGRNDYCPDHAYLSEERERGLVEE